MNYLIGFIYLQCKDEELTLNIFKRMVEMYFENMFTSNLGRLKLLFFQFEKCLDLCCISPSSALLRSDLFKDIGYFDVSFPACEDYDFWLRVTAREKVLFLDEPLTIKYGGHDDQLSKKYWGMDRFRVKALEKLILNYELNSKQKKIALKSLISRLEIIVNGAKKRNSQNIVKTIVSAKSG